jgi:hypothetical protein
VNLIKMMLQDSDGKVKIQEQLTEAFNIERGLRQGDALATTLFNIVLKVIRNFETDPNGTIFNIMRQYIAYADDALIFGQLVRLTEEVVTQLKEAA